MGTNIGWLGNWCLKKRVVCWFSSFHRTFHLCHQLSVTLNNVSFHSQWQNWWQRGSLNHDHVAADAEDDDSTRGTGFPASCEQTKGTTTPGFSHQSSWLKVTSNINFKSLPNFSFKILLKYGFKYWIQPQNLDKTSALKSLQDFTFKILTNVQA